MRVSIEIFLFDNWLMNVVVLCCAAALSGLRLRPALAGVLALCGGIYAMLAMGVWQVLLLAPARFLFAGVMALGLRFGGWRGYLRALLSVLACAFLLGGLLLALPSLGLKNSVAMENGVMIGTVGLRAVLVCLGVSALLPRFLRRLRAAARVDEHHIRLRVTMAGKCFEVLAILDTGNLLREPVTGLPVVLINNCPETKEKLPVQFSSVGGAGELLCGHVESAQIKLKSGWHEVDIMVARAPQQVRGAQAIMGIAALPPESAEEHIKWCFSLAKQRLLPYKSGKS